MAWWDRLGQKTIDIQTELEKLRQKYEKKEESTEFREVDKIPTFLPYERPKPPPISEAVTAPYTPKVARVEPPRVIKGFYEQPITGARTPIYEEPKGMERIEQPLGEFLESPVGQTLTALSAIIPIAFGVYGGVKSLPAITRDLTDQTLQKALNLGLDKWIAQRSRGVPPQYAKKLQDLLYNFLAKDRTWLQERATENWLVRKGKTPNVGVRQAVEDTINDVEQRVSAIIPKGTQTGAMAFGGLPKKPEGLPPIIPQKPEITTYQEYIGAEIKSRLAETELGLVGLAGKLQGIVEEVRVISGEPNFKVRLADKSTMWIPVDDAQLMRTAQDISEGITAGAKGKAKDIIPPKVTPVTPEVTETIERFKPSLVTTNHQTPFVDTEGFSTNPNIIHNEKARELIGKPDIGKYMQQTGSIRVSGGVGEINIEIQKMPTEAQFQTLKTMAGDNKINFDISSTDMKVLKSGTVDNFADFRRQVTGFTAIPKAEDGMPEAGLSQKDLQDLSVAVGKENVARISERANQIIKEEGVSKAEAIESAIREMPEAVTPPAEVKPAIPKEGKIIPEVPAVEEVTRLAEQLKAKLPVELPIAKSPVERRAEIQSLLKEPAKNLPKGTTKIALRKELAGLNKTLTPQGKSLRQQIMATVKVKSLPEKQYRDIFKTVGGSRHLTDINLTQLEKILKSVQRARPKKIGGKIVVTQRTEDAIQSLKTELIKQGKITEDTYGNIKKYLRLKIDKFESPAKFISEKEAKELIRTMNFEAEVGLLEHETQVAKVLENQPTLKSEIDRISKQANTEMASYVNKGVKVSPWWDMWVYNEKLQNRTGKPFYDIYRLILDKRLANVSKAEDIFKKIMDSTPEYNNVVKSDASLEKINNYLASKLGEKVKVAEDMTAEETAIAKAIEDILFSFQNSVRYNRFMTAYDTHEGNVVKMSVDIPNAPKEDLREAIRIYESGGASQLSEYLNTKAWGVIKSGYEPHIVVNPKLQLRRIKKTILAKGMLKTREGITFDHGEKTIIDRTHTYVHRMLNLELEPYFKKLDMILRDATPQLREAGKTASELSLMIDEMKGTFYIDEPLARVIAKAGGYATSVVYLSPHLGFRNLFQNLAMYPDRTALVNPANIKLSDEALTYFETYVNQGRQFTQQFLLQRELGSGRIANFLRRISFMGVSESINNHWAFWAGVNKAERALSVFKKTGDVKKFINASGLSDLTLRQQKEVLELLALGKEKEAEWLIARKINQNTNMIYDRAQGAPVTMGTSGRLLGSLLNFTRGYWQRVGQQLGKLAPGHTGRETKHAVKILLGLAVFGTVAGELYKKITGKKQNPYNPLLMLTWSPGGLAVGATADTADVVNTIFQAITGDEESMMRLPTELARSSDLLVPFYSVILNILEASTDTKFVDRLALRKVISLLKTNYKPNEDFYQKERDWVGKFQHALFGGEPETQKEPEIPTEKIPSPPWRESKTLKSEKIPPPPWRQ